MHSCRIRCRMKMCVAHTTRRPCQTSPSRCSVAVAAPQQYTEQCFRLIAQYKTIANTLAGGDESKQVEYAERFMRDWGLSGCRRAHKRLMEEGVPITSLHSHSESRGESVHVAETVRCVLCARVLPGVALSSVALRL